MSEKPILASNNDFEIRVSVECCIIANNHVLMQRRSPNSTNWPNYLTFPGGHIDLGEDPLTAIIREVKEETGVDIENVRLKVNCINTHLDRKQIWVVFGFLAKIEAKIDLINTEEGSCEWIEINKLKNTSNIFPPIAFYFDHILNDQAGILYTSGEWEKSQLKKLTSKILDLNK